jgi:hypothetical protein
LLICEVLIEADTRKLAYRWSRNFWRSGSRFKGSRWSLGAGWALRGSFFVLWARLSNPFGRTFWAANTIGAALISIGTATNRIHVL